MCICVNGNKMFLGYFSDFQEAVAVRKAAEKQHFGEYARDEASTPPPSAIATNAAIASKIQNRPRQIDKRSKSGVTGVTWNARTNQWQVQITDSGTRRHIGWFRDKEAAIAARKQAEDEINARKQPLLEIEL